MCGGMGKKKELASNKFLHNLQSLHF
jgi:hypothetical protein